MRRIIFVITTVFIMVFGIGMTAKAASLKDNNTGISQEQYRVMEEEYISEVRLILLEKGCKNAGIALTYIMDEKGNRDYTVTVHHAKLEKMENQELAILEARMQEVAESTLLTSVSFKRL